MFGKIKDIRDNMKMLKEFIVVDKLLLHPKSPKDNKDGTIHTREAKKRPNKRSSTTNGKAPILKYLYSES